MGGRRGLVILALAAAILVAMILYRSTGMDGGADAAPINDDPLTIEQLQEAADEAGDDARPWQELGFAYFQQGEFSSAANAYRRAVEIDDGEAVLWSALGEAIVMASERDPMPRDALEAFNRASELNPRDPRARYFLNVQRDLEQDHEGAITGWLELLADTPQGAPWESDLVRTIEQVGAINSIEVGDRIAAASAVRPAMTASGSVQRGPTQAEIAAAGAIPPSEQRAMAEGMVQRLDARLQSDPSDVEGWVMLMRSRMTLGEVERASEALRAAIAANPSAESRLRQEAQALGVR